MQFQLLGKLALDSHVSDLQFTFLGDHKRIPSWPQFDFPSSLASFLHPDIKDHITVLVLFDDISSFTCFEQILSTGVQFPSLYSNQKAEIAIWEDCQHKSKPIKNSNMEGLWALRPHCSWEVICSWWLFGEEEWLFFLIVATDRFPMSQWWMTLCPWAVVVTLYILSKCLYVSMNIYVYTHRYKTTIYERWCYKFERARRNIWKGFGEKRQREHDVITISKFIIII